MARNCDHCMTFKELRKLGYGSELKSVVQQYPTTKQNKIVWFPKKTLFEWSLKFICYNLVVWGPPRAAITP